MMKAERTSNRLIGIVYRPYLMAGESRKPHGVGLAQGFDRPLKIGAYGKNRRVPDQDDGRIWFMAGNREATIDALWKVEEKRRSSTGSCAMSAAATVSRVALEIAASLLEQETHGPSRPSRQCRIHRQIFRTDARSARCRVRHPPISDDFVAGARSSRLVRSRRISVVAERAMAGETRRLLYRRHSLSGRGR